MALNTSRAADSLHRSCAVSLVLCHGNVHNFQTYSKLRAALWPNIENSQITLEFLRRERTKDEKTSLGKLRGTVAVTGTYLTFLPKSYSSSASELSYKSKHLCICLPFRLCIHCHCHRANYKAADKNLPIRSPVITGGKKKL